MDSVPPRYRVLRFLAISLLLLGALDPMEGSVLITVGSALLALQMHFTNDQRKRLFITASGMIISGVLFLFIFSSLGGFGKGHLSWWWGLLVLPYPMGWMITVISLLDTDIRKKRGG
jgi:hypothetical protein